MLSFGGSNRSETGEDQRLYLDGRLREVACQDCLARVLVKKNSEHHTSIQWSQQALGDCAEFQRLDREGGRRVHTACGRLRASIEKAVEQGDLTIGATDGY
ncbi:hypothetical protein EON82_22595 [bacterium]|nr:MAG: hypothetical protein EON82_22595 [bacterium]